MSRTFSFVAALVVAAAFVVPAFAQEPGLVPVPTTVSPTASAARPKSAVVERVLVRVNGEIFTQSQLTNSQIEALQELNRPADSALESSLLEVTPRILVSSVDELLLVQRGREMGVKFSDEQFRVAVDNIKRENKLDDATFGAALQQAGLTTELLRQRLERSYLISAVQQREVGPSLTITVEEMRQYYERNKAKFMTPLTVTLRELMVAVPTQTVGGQSVVSAADDDAAKAKIEALRARAVGGEDFARLVAEASDSATKGNGGVVGPINADDLNPTLKQAIEALQPGGVTSPIKGPRGYQIFRLEERVVPALKPFDSVRIEIEQALREERLGPETQKLLGRLRAQAVIEWKDEDLRKLYEQELARQAAQ